MCSGGSHSDCVILNENGERVGHSTGPGTNPWGIGFKEAVKELTTMVKKAKEDAGIPLDHPLNSLVCLTCCYLYLFSHLTLSRGCHLVEENRRRLRGGLLMQYPVLILTLLLTLMCLLIHLVPLLLHFMEVYCNHGIVS